jgi:hypothetical protein
MRNTLKTTLAVLTALAIIPTAATAALRVGSPFPGTVTATTYYSNGDPHRAVDISSGRCNYWGVETGVYANLYWNVTVRTTGIVCSDDRSGYQNEAKHTFSNGNVFRLWHFIANADSRDRTCDRCQVGNEGGTGRATGAHVHLEFDVNGTNSTAWYSNYTVRGEFLDRGETVGYIN